MAKDTTKEVVDAGPALPEGVRVYELGFHFAPIIAEADVAVQFSHLKAIIEKNAGEFISEDFPKLQPLSYEISQTIKAQKRSYDHAYFGWVKFTLSADKLADVEKEVKAFDPIIRYIFIKTVKEDTMSAPVVAAAEGAEKAPTDAPRRRSTKEAAPAINVAQVDKKIEEMVA